MIRLNLMSLGIALGVLASAVIITAIFPQTWEFGRLLLLSFFATLFIWSMYELTVKSAIKDELPVKLIAYEVVLIWVTPLLAGTILGSWLS